MRLSDLSPGTLFSFEREVTEVFKMVGCEYDLKDDTIQNVVTKRVIFKSGDRWLINDYRTSHDANPYANVFKIDIVCLT